MFSVGCSLHLYNITSNYDGDIPWSLLWRLLLAAPPPSSRSTRTRSTHRNPETRRIGGNVPQMVAHKYALGYKTIGKPHKLCHGIRLGSHPFSDLESHAKRRKPILCRVRFLEIYRWSVARTRASSSPHRSSRSAQP